MDADAALFDEAALVQMAGRAGRSADDPCGRVYYVARSRTDGLDAGRPSDPRDECPRAAEGC